MIMQAPAKINLGLDVLCRRPDGYHEVDMIMQTIDLFDTVTIEKSEKPGIELSTNKPELPNDEGNLAYKAAKLLFETCGEKESGVRIHIEKRIPMAAGLAGGSTDCAAVLSGMNTLFSFGLSMERLMELGKTLGADVPYCLLQGTARSQGIGEKLTPLPKMMCCPVLIAKPGVAVSTKAVYEGLRLDEATAHPDIDALESDIRRQDLAALAKDMGNLLATVTEELHPVIKEIRALMEAHGALRAMMSGSGPTVFGLFSDMKTAQEAEAAMRDANLAPDVCLTSISE
ncbi:MAG: 4-(cytidine 5'-diphospho)-2-C-methyl-D-erythritol kinase [Lachnospiraceae bacterium]|nr:4-(cytidine 5'-diphospho)-2-C-methyl-D-erythritol kinase [Lachnospiraceae bacterium]